MNQSASSSTALFAETGIQPASQFANSCFRVFEDPDLRCLRLRGINVTLGKEKLETRSIAEDHSHPAALRRLGVQTCFWMVRLMRLSLSLPQGQNLSTLSPAIIFGPMFQKSDDPAIQEDPQQTGLLHRLSSCSDLRTGKENSHLLTQ